METITNIENKQVWTIQDVCQYTGFKTGYIYQLTHRRVIPHYKPTGKKIFFNPDEIKKWLLSKSVSTTDFLKVEAQAAIARLDSRQRRVNN